MLCSIRLLQSEYKIKSLRRQGFIHDDVCLAVADGKECVVIMRKALHISPNVYENILSAGGTRMIWEELAKNYDEYHILARSKDMKCHTERAGKIVLHTIPNILNKTYPFFFTSYIYLKKLLRQEIFNIVICQCSIFGGYSAVKLLKGNIPILIEIHGFFYFKMMSSDKLVDKILTKIIRHSFENCTMIRSLNKSMTAALRELGIKNNIQEVENRVNLQLFEGYKQDQIVDSEVKLISIGNFVESKGHRFAFDALRQLKDKYNISLVLISGGILKDTYKKIIKEYKIKVELIDRVSQEELKDYLRKSNIYIHTSIREGMPRVILEAMAMKLPVISSKAGFIEGTIDDKRNGLLTEIGDVNGLVDDIEYLINHEEERVRLTENAYKDILERFEWNKCFDQYRALLEKVENL